ncbi:hypothetical protein RhiirA4_515889, partial [Rhizophagus irregularis]
MPRQRRTICRIDPNNERIITLYMDKWSSWWNKLDPRLCLTIHVPFTHREKEYIYEWVEEYLSYNNNKKIPWKTLQSNMEKVFERTFSRQPNAGVLCGTREPEVSSNIEEIEENGTGEFEGSSTEEFKSSSIEEFEGSNTKKSIVSSNIEEIEESGTGEFKGNGTEEFENSSIEKFEESNTKESKVVGR